MAIISILGNQDVAVAIPIPKPAIILPGMGVKEWKDFFIQKVRESDDYTEKTSYNKCLKVLMWAEFCNATLTKVGNMSQACGGMAFKFTFHFPNLKCRMHFDRNLEENLEAVSSS